MGKRLPIGALAHDQLLLRLSQPLRVVLRQKHYDQNARDDCFGPEIVVIGPLTSIGNPGEAACPRALGVGHQCYRRPLADRLYDTQRKQLQLAHRPWKTALFVWVKRIIETSRGLRS